MTDSLSTKQKDKIYELLMEYRTFILTNKVTTYSERQLVEQFMYWNATYLKRWVNDLCSGILGANDE